jgi:TRAF3-interacting protein 1
MSSPPAESKNDDNSNSNTAKESRSSKDIDGPVEVNDRGRSRGGTRGGKPTSSSIDTGLNRTAEIPNLDKEIEKCDGSEALTQTMLGELITRPKLTDKLLSKPPFRFLFDIVMEITKATGFAKFLYNEDEMNSANITEKAQKLNFLEKIIKVVGLQLNTIVVAQPMKIIAGQDAENTNIFLQQLAIAAKYAPKAHAAVKTVIEELGGGLLNELEASLASAPKSEAPPPRKAQPQAPVAEAKDEVYAPAKNENMNAAMNDGDGESKRSVRPMTGTRRLPPKVKESVLEVSAKETASSKKTEGILIDGQDDEVGRTNLRYPISVSLLMV